ncbi:MAG: hypothetical protein F6K09_10230 [Merismopedia sp. SIO2A8]|nr:hypothetical protein [Merismopedia sp. SIO2A8]
MPDSAGLILKVLLLSTGISIAIKYGVPVLSKIPVTSAIALTTVLLPCLIMMGLLGWRSLQTNDNNPHH